MILLGLTYAFLKGYQPNPLEENDSAPQFWSDIDKIKLKFKDMGRVMKFKDLFGPYAAYVKKNEPLACPETAPALSGRSQRHRRTPATLRMGWGGVATALVELEII